MLYFTVPEITFVVHLGEPISSGKRDLAESTSNLMTNTTESGRRLSYSDMIQA